MADTMGYSPGQFKFLKGASDFLKGKAKPPKEDTSLNGVQNIAAMLMQLRDGKLADDRVAQIPVYTPGQIQTMQTMLQNGYPELAASAGQILAKYGKVTKDKTPPDSVSAASPMYPSMKG
jgi:hypothetical protein